MSRRLTGICGDWQCAVVIDNHLHLASLNTSPEGPVPIRTSLLKPLLYALLLLWGAPAMAQSSAAEVQTTWRLLDYIAVDYAGAISNGRVISQLEYDEMIEFSASVEERLAKLPAAPAKSGLVKRSKALRSVIAAKSPPPAVDKLARGLAADLLKG